MPKKEFQPQQARCIAYCKQVTLTDRGGKRVVKVNLEIELPAWVNVQTLAPIQGQLVDCYMETMPPDLAKDAAVEQGSGAEAKFQQ